MSQLVGDDGRHPFLVGVGGEAGIIEQSSLPVGDQAPVLHGTSIEVWERNLICIRMEMEMALALAPKHSCGSGPGWRRRVVLVLVLLL